jgi:lysophospholipase L1-like esterase
MSSHQVMAVIAAVVCFAVGVAVGLGLAIVKPGSARNLALKTGQSDPYKQWYYEQMVKYHKRIDACVPEGAVIFVGDSFIQGLCVTEVAKDGINYGIGNDTTEGVLARLPIYTSLTHARAVVFAVGDNDLRQGRSEAEVAVNYQKIVAQVPKTVPIFFCSIVPCVEEPQFVEINRGIESLNRSLKELCASQPRCHLMDLRPAFNDAHGCLQREFAEEDGVHLNGQGYRLCIERVREVLLPALSANANRGV